eukprot:357477-Chlamydomonas_euryale.AAC.1
MPHLVPHVDEVAKAVERDRVLQERAEVWDRLKRHDPARHWKLLLELAWEQRAASWQLPPADFQSGMPPRRTRLRG